MEDVLLRLAIYSTLQLRFCLNEFLDVLNAPLHQAADAILHRLIDRHVSYFGVELERWLVEEGIERELGQDILEAKRPSFRFVHDFSASAFGVAFDFVLAQSVLSHTYPDLAAKALGEVARVLAPEGLLFATFIEGEWTPKGSGWVKAAVSYRWERMGTLVEDAGMVARRLAWPHPRQKWFVAGLSEAEPLIEDLSERLRPPLRT